MNSKRIEKMIPEAIHLIENREVDIFIGGEEKIDSRFNGYVAAYGPTIRQTRLLPTLAFYNKDERLKINKLLLRILQGCELIEEKEGTNLYKIIEGKIKDATSTIRNRWKSIILDAVVASKLAIKTFPIVRSEGNDN